MKIVIDANILIAMLIKPGKPIDIFLADQLDIYAPEQLFIELEKNKNIIVQKSGLNEEEIVKAISVFREIIHIIPEKKFLEYREMALKTCPCPKDISYFALALYLKCPIWSNEKLLHEKARKLLVLTSR